MSTIEDGPSPAVLRPMRGTLPFNFSPSLGGVCTLKASGYECEPVSVDMRASLCPWG
jgi:hypothetical protein